MKRSTLALLALLGFPFAAARAWAADEPPPAPPAPPAEEPKADEPKPEDRKPEEDPAARLARLLEQMKSEDPGVRLTAAEESADVQQGEILTPLIRLAKDDSKAVREAAVKALGARLDADARKKAATALAARLAPLSKEADTSEILVVVKALHDFAEPSTVKALLDGIEIDSDNEVVRARLRAVGNVPTKDAIEELIQFASKGRNRGSDGKRGLAVQAIEYAVGRRFGGLEEIHVWWSHNKKTFDPEAAAAQRKEARDQAEEERRKKEERRKEREKKEGEKQGKKDGQGDEKKES